ncbi:DUF6011 domain-containing protein [Streptomyces sp. NPDC086010]|uniref:DUF6011 domain-containing protein n=1 Tax=Streptomyces sp. NPDC086010 TaxID=3365745 RepID=UPI0037D2E39B
MESPEPFPEFPEPQPGPAPAPGRRAVRCGLCGRPLTGAESRRAGLGPACDAKLHPAGPDIRTRRHEVDQDPLPGT